MKSDVWVGAALLAGAVLIAAVILFMGPYLVPHRFPAGIPSFDNDRPSQEIPGSPTGVSSVAPSAEDTAPSPAITTPGTPSSPTVSGPPSFTLLVTPVEVRARPGDIVLYTLSIEPKGGFDQPVSLSLMVSALLLYRNSFDLGYVTPPYPRTVEYRFRVPSDIPGGITVKGVLTAEGGGHREEQDLILLVGI